MDVDVDARTRARPRRRRGSRHPLVTKLWVLVGLVSAADFVFGATFVVHMRDRGISAATIGLLLAVTGIVSTFVEAPSGAWGDRSGQRRLMVLGLLAWGSGQLLFAVSSGTASFAVALLLWTTGIALHSGTGPALVVNHLKQAGLADRVDAAVRGSQVMRWVASALGAGTVALLGERVDPWQTIAVAGALLLPTAVWVHRAWPESTPVGHGVGESLRRGFRFAVVGECRLVLLFTVLSSVAVAVIILAWQPVTLEVLDLPASALGVVLLALSVASAGGAASTRLVARVRPALAVAVVLVVLCGFLAATALGPVGAAVGFLGAEVCIGAALTIVAVWGQRVFPDELRTTLTSIMGTATGVSMALTNGVLGALWEGLGIVPAVLVAAGAVGVASLVAGVVGRARRTPAVTLAQD